MPTQQELLAQFRCDEISAVALSEFNEQAKSQKRPVEAGKVVEGLGGMMKTWRQDALGQYSFINLSSVSATHSDLTHALARYDRDASRYHKGVYTRKRTDLLAALDTTLTPLFVGQLKNLHKACLAAFKQEMLDGMRGEEYNFAEVVATAKERCEGRFTADAEEAILDDTDWSWEDELQLLEEEVGTVADQCRKDETKKMLNQIEVCFCCGCFDARDAYQQCFFGFQRNIKKQLAEPVELQLNRPSKEMWDNILRTFREVLGKAETAYLTKAKSKPCLHGFTTTCTERAIDVLGFNSTEKENTVALAALRKRAWLALRAKIDEQTADPAFLSKLRNHFEERFRYDEGGVPRVWKPDDDIDGAFKKAKEQVGLSATFLHSRGKAKFTDYLVVFLKYLFVDARAGAAVFENSARGQHARIRAPVRVFRLARGHGRIRLPGDTRRV